MFCDDFLLYVSYPQWRLAIIKEIVCLLDVTPHSKYRPVFSILNSRDLLFAWLGLSQRNWFFHS